MKFKVDENLPVEAANLLRKNAHDAVTVMEQHLKGSTDSNLSSICQQENRVLVTLDTDFADIRVYPPEDFSGLLVLHLKRQDKDYVLNVLTRLIKMFSNEPLDKHLWIVEEGRVRIRG